MFNLRCSECGWEQPVKHMSAEKRRELESARYVFCGRNACPSTHNFRNPAGCVHIMMWRGSWSIVREATLDEYRAIKRAREIRDAAVDKHNGAR